MISESRKRATYKYAKNHLHRIPLDVKNEDYEKIKEAAEAAGETVNGYIKKLIWERIGRS